MKPCRDCPDCAPRFDGSHPKPGFDYCEGCGHIFPGPTLDDDFLCDACQPEPCCWSCGEAAPMEAMYPVGGGDMEFVCPCGGINLLTP